jgi:tetratricopeptide (TPR) repeat protein
MRASLVTVVFLWAVLVGHLSPSSAQNIPTPAGQSLCDSPSSRGTAAYNYYCGACYPHCGNGGNTNYDYGVVQRAQADAERKRNASAADQEGLAAESRGDLEEAANQFMKAENIDPESAEIEAHLEHVKAELAARRADQESAEQILAERKRIDDSINAAHIRAQGMEMEERIARHQERAAAVDPVSAACIFDGTPGCTEPIPLAVVNSGMPPIPADAARFIESIPEKFREMPDVKRKIDYYSRTARIRGELQNKMIADKAAAGPNPQGEAKLRLIGDEGPLNAAKVDEKAAKKPLLDFSADTIELGPALGNGDHPK